MNKKFLLWQASRARAVTLSTRGPYCVLTPNNVKLFDDLKEFVERIPSKAFAPYFTTDLRQMTWRYYRVTVDKCGWLIEDYLNL